MSTNYGPLTDMVQNLRQLPQKALYYMTGGPIEKAMGVTPFVPYPPQVMEPEQGSSTNPGTLPSAWEKANQESVQQSLHQMKKPLPKGK